ncbi:hypothetical protein [Streptomyces synnematoformans]|uniref:Integral membrane protein n=1 Tax=Streptomyces synnematoformans TaxID=415721 RepID=A0ABP5L2Q4_9ACTN
MHETSPEGAPARSRKAVIPVQVVEGGGPLTFLRVMAVLCLLMILTQGLLAGMLMNGDVDSIDPHGVGAYVFEALALVQLVAAVMLWRRNRELKWVLSAGIGILLTAFIQVFLGLESSTSAHVTVGVLMAVMETTLLMRCLMLQVAEPEPEPAPA